jgi:peroxiredoxin
MKSLATLALLGAFCLSPAQKEFDAKVEPLMVRLRASVTNFDLMMNQITTQRQAENTYKQYLASLKVIAEDAGMYEANAKDKGTKCRLSMVYFQTMANYLNDFSQVEKIAANLLEKYRDSDALCQPIEESVFVQYLGIDRYKKLEANLLKSKNPEVVASTALTKELLAFADEKGDLNRLRTLSVTYAKTKAGARAKRVYDLRTKFILSRPAPSYEFALSDGKKINLAELKGKITIIHFWGFWCGEEINGYRDLVLKNANLVQVMGINTDPWNVTYTGARIKDRQYWWPNHFAVGLTTIVPMDFGILSYPATIIIDAEGIVRSVPGVGNWRETMDKLLGN